MNVSTLFLFPRFFRYRDADSCYWQEEVADEDPKKAAFASHNRLLRLIRMPFGPKDAPKTFQRAMDNILFSNKWQFAQVYLEDIVIFYVPR